MLQFIKYIVLALGPWLLVLTLGGGFVLALQLEFIWISFVVIAWLVHWVQA